MRSAAVIIMGIALSGCAIPEYGQASIPSRRTQSNIADPHFLNQYAATRRFSLGRPTSIKFLPDGTGVLFLRSGPRSFVQNLYEFDIKARREKLLLTAESILQGSDERLSPEERARRERMRMTARGIASYQISDDGAKILVPLSGRLFVIYRTDGAVTELHSERGYPIDPKFSPDGRYVSCVRDGELYVMELATGKERVLTDGAGDTITNGLAEFVAQEEMGRFEGYWWSPDGQTIAVQRTDTSGLETMHIMDATHPNRKPQAWPYPRPGKPNADVRIGLVALEGGPTRWVTWDRRRYPYLATVRWEENAPLTILVQNRRQTEEILLTVDIETGITSALLTERDEAWLNLDPEMPHWLPNGDGFLWTTERNGAWQLELRARNGELVKPLTDTGFSYQGLADFDADSASVFVLGSPDPTQTYIYRIDLQPTPHKPVRVTEEPGMHQAVFSEDHLRYVHKAETMNAERSLTVRSRDGREIGRLRSVAEKPPFVPNIELTTVGVDPAFHAVLVRPQDFDPRRRYPVIVNVYGGPHGRMVAASPNRYLLQQWIADHGFIVVSIDGRGTPGRGRRWERSIQGNLIEVPLADQVAGLRALGRTYGELDLGRVGIYGWSFGGYFSAMAVMRRPDVFHVGVAGAPVCDWRDYDTHYTERYMGLPGENEQGYEKASVLTYASRLRRPLLIIHGTADDNVYFMHSLKMSNALFRAGREHDFLALSDFTHMVSDPLVTTRLYERIVGYFEKHLTGP